MFGVLCGKYTLFSIEKKFSAHALSYGFDFLDIDAVILYDVISLKYACAVYRKPWSLWSCSSAVAFSFFLASLIVESTRLIFCPVPILYVTILLSYKSLIIDRYRKP